MFYIIFLYIVFSNLPPKQPAVFIEHDKLKSDVEKGFLGHIKQRCSMGNPRTKLNPATSLRLCHENALKHIIS